MSEIDIEEFINTNDQILNNPLWIYKKSEIASRLANNTNYKLNIKFSSPQMYKMENILSTLWVSGGTFVVISVFQIALDTLFQWADREVASRILKFYLIYSALCSNNIKKHVDNIAFDITAKYFLRYKNKAEKIYSAPSIKDSIFDSIKLLKAGTWSFKELTDQEFKKIDQKRKEYIKEHINLMTIAYIVNCYYLFDLSDSDFKELLNKYTFKEYEDLLECRPDESNQINLSIYNIDDDYNDRSKFRKYFDEKYSQVITSKDIMDYISRE